MKKALLIIDPQYDFITGSLPVPGAEKAMDSLAEYISEHPNDYECKIITLDWHPCDHSSFSDRGGQWPTHCVAFSKGASVWQRLLEAVCSTDGSNHFLTKGTKAEKEEYSIFQNEISRKTLIDIIESGGIEQIDICGIAGDVCVLSTLSDGYEIFGCSKFNVLESFSPSLDGGAKLHDFLVS